MLRPLLLALCGLFAAAAAAGAEPRTAVLTAFAPEYEAIRARMGDVEVRTERGAEYLFGTLGGRDVIVGQTGISMVNAAMNTQLLVDLHRPKSIVVSGIAGGVDPALDVGDVLVPARWGQYLEAVFARRTPDGGYAVPPFFDRETPNYGMIFPQGIAVWRGDHGAEKTRWFEADAAMLAAARAAAKTVEFRIAAENAARTVEALIRNLPDDR